MSGSVLVVHYETTTGTYKVQKVGSAQISDGAITSALIASGIIGWPHIGAGAILSGHIGSGQIASGHLTSAIAALVGTVADGAITSSKIASGQVGDAHIYPGAILSAKIAANIIATPHILNQGILSASLAVGVIGHTLVADYGIISGKIASGAITENELVSGISIDISEMVQEPSYRAEDLISAYLGVQFSVSGYFNYAGAKDIDTMPAIGISIDNIASGSLGTFRTLGRITNPAWDFSGYVGSLLFMGTSSEVTLTAPSASGECAQRIGKVVGHDTMFLKPELAFVQIAE